MKKLEYIDEIISGITARSAKLPTLEWAIVDSACDELMHYILNVDFHWAEFNGELGSLPKKYPNESLEDYVFRRVTIHWYIVNSYWAIAVEGKGGMSDECVTILKELKELADHGLEVARNLGVLEGEANVV